MWNSLNPDAKLALMSMVGVTTAQVAVGNHYSYDVCTGRVRCCSSRRCSDTLDRGTVACPHPSIRKVNAEFELLGKYFKT